MEEINLTEEEKKRFKELENKNKIKKTTIQKINNLLKEGLSFGNISFILNIPKSTIYKYSKLKNGD